MHTVAHNLIKRSLCLSEIVMAGLGKGNNACSVLNSYHQGCKYDLVEESGPPHMKEFTFSVNVLGQDFAGKGRSKKHAKQAAAALALRRLYGVNLSLGTEEVHEVHEPSGELLSYVTEL